MAIYFDVTETAYHSDAIDPGPPTLSASIAQILDRQSPAHAREAHPRLGARARKWSKSLDEGSLVHRMLLGKGADFVSVTADDWRTKDAQMMRKEAWSLGKIPVLQRDHERLFDAAQAIRRQLPALGVELDGASEVTVTWDEQSAASETGRTSCRGRLDHLRDAQILDLKSCRSAHPDACTRHVNSFGYAIQRAAYVSAIETNRPELAGRVDFVFVFFELEAPFVVTPVRLSGEFRALGERRWRRAVELWAACLRADDWPGYAREVMTLDAPAWALANDMEREVDEDEGAEAAEE